MIAEAFIATAVFWAIGLGFVSFLYACTVVAFPNCRNMLERVDTRPIFWFVGLVAFVAAAANSAMAEAPRYISGHAQVVDGDTLIVGQYRVRIQGIDAPEAKFPAGFRATHALGAILGNGEAKCQINYTDRYNRLVGTCSVNGTDLGRFMVSRGWALNAPNYEPDYSEAQDWAAYSCKGMWRVQCFPLDGGS